MESRGFSHPYLISRLRYDYRCAIYLCLISAWSTFFLLTPQSTPKEPTNVLSNPQKYESWRQISSRSEPVGHFLLRHDHNYQYGADPHCCARALFVKNLRSAFSSPNVPHPFFQPLPSLGSEQAANVAHAATMSHQKSSSTFLANSALYGTL